MDTVQHGVTTIANGASVSGIIDCREFTLRALLIPATWTAASITFLGSLDHDPLVATEGNFYSVKDAAGAEVAVAADDSSIQSIFGDYLQGIPFIKLRSGVEATPVAQGAARSIGYGMERNQ